MTIRLLTPQVAAIIAALALIGGCGAPSMGRDAQAADVASDSPIDALAVCMSDQACDDHVFCNGVERCTPGAAGTDARGCTAASPPNPCLQAQSCNEAMARCQPAGCGATTDADRDGHPSIACGGDDCDDSDPNRFPGNTEVCATPTATGADAGMALMRVDPMHDEDCDPTTFANATTRDGDHDGDGYVDVACANIDRSGMIYRGTDCDDLSTTTGLLGTPARLDVAPGDVHPMQVEVCNGVDDNCNGQIDEGVQVRFYRDCDGDGFGDQTDPGMLGCASLQFSVCAGHQTVQNHTDCNDGNGSIHPGATPMCDAMMTDWTCSGSPGTGCGCAVGSTPRACGPGFPGCPSGTQMCVMDATGSRWTTCSVSPTVIPCYADADGDGFAAVGASTLMACTCPVGTTTSRAPIGAAIDCDDSHYAVNPTATEACNDVDDNCDGSVDNLPSATCRHSGTQNVNVCGVPCLQSCGPVACQWTPSCTLSQYSWRWVAGTSDTQTVSGSVSCGALPGVCSGGSAYSSFRMFAPAASPPLPPGDYTATVGAACGSTPCALTLRAIVTWYMGAWRGSTIHTQTVMFPAGSLSSQAIRFNTSESTLPSCSYSMTLELLGVGTADFFRALDFSLVRSDATLPLPIPLS